MNTTYRALLTRGWFFALSFSACLFGQTMPQNFVSVTPCRIADTRTSSGGPGPIPGGTYQNFTVAGVCNIPSNASAFSLNVTALPSPAGSSLYFLSVLPAPASMSSGPPSSSTLNDPSGTIIANAAIVPSGSNGAVTVYVSDTSDVILDINGYFVDETSSNYGTSLGTGAGGSTGSTNTAVGYDAISGGTGIANSALGYRALQSDTTGSNNTAVGDIALQSNTTGSDNSAFGYQSLYLNTTGSFNTAFGAVSLTQNTSGSNSAAFGHGSLYSNTTGPSNAAFGFEALFYNITGGNNSGFGPQALFSNNGSANTALGASALYANTSGSNSTAIGYASLANATGSGNIALGYYAGTGVTSGNNVIEIGNRGNSGDSGVIRIGAGDTQSATYIAGISGVTVTGAAVLVDSNGQLGVQSSSIRFKEDVHNMADSSDALMQLRPVEFRYKQSEADGTKPLQFGLVAEEVAKVYPELVVRNKEGQIDSVQYHQLPAMLLNEIQKQHRTITDQEQEIQQLKAEMREVRALVANK